MSIVLPVALLSRLRLSPANERQHGLSRIGTIRDVSGRGKRHVVVFKFSTGCRLVACLLLDPGSACIQACKNQKQQEMDDMACQLCALERQRDELESRSRMLDLILNTKHAQVKILQEGIPHQVQRSMHLLTSKFVRWLFTGTQM